MKKTSQRLRQFFLPVALFLSSHAVAQQTCDGSLQFDVSNISVELPPNNQYYSGFNDGFTWECWFKLNTPLGNANRPLISAVDTVQFDDIYLGFGWSGGWYNAPPTTLIFRVDPPSSGFPVDPNCAFAPSAGFMVNRWYHAAGVIDYKAKKKYLYLDGVLVDTQAATSAPITRVIQTNLSACTSCGPANNLDGRMDEVRIWDRPLSSSEINTWYNQCRSGNEANMLVYYRCNQVGALSVLDATPNFNNGDFFNITPSWSTDNCPVAGINCIKACDCLGSLEFDASNDAVELPPNNQYYSGNGYTWECWFKLNQPLGSVDKPLISAVDWTLFEDMYFGFGWHGGFFNTDYDSLVFRVEGPASVWPSEQSCKWAPAGGFIVGQWYHAAGVADYQNFQKHLYVNGVPVDTKPLTVLPNTRVIQTNLSACDGCTASNSNYSNMDEVRIWDRVLSPSEIATWYDNCRAGNEANLLVYYRCNQVGATTVFDGTGNGNTGMFRNSMGWSVENAPVTGTCRKDCNRNALPDDPQNPSGKATSIRQQTNGDAGLSIYPNPSSGSIKVSAEQPGVLTVYSITGQILSEINVDVNEHEVKLQGFKAGIYLYVFTSGSSTSSGKLVIE